MQVEVLGPENPAWLEALSRFDGDVYHLPAYAELEARRRGGEALALLVSDDRHSLLLPLILLPTLIGGHEPLGDSMDAFSPYGYPAPLLSADAGDDFVAAALAALREHLATLGVAGLFLRMHPMMDFPAKPYTDNGCLVTHGQTVWMDLTLGIDAAWSQIRPRFRSYINKLQRLGLVAAADPEFVHYARFQELYTETMHHVGADPMYFFDNTYFDDLRRALGVALQLFTVCAPDNEVVSAALFFEHHGKVQYHLSGTVKGGGHRDALKLLLHSARNWFSLRGNRWLHLGGGLGGTKDDLMHFKAGFSNARASFHTWRTICDPQRYAAACKCWEQLASQGCEDLHGYFPPYHRPVSA